MSELKRINGKSIFLDEKNYYRTKEHTWSLCGTGNKALKATIKNKTIYLATFLMGNPPEGFLWDHIDRNIYNNYESNLRLATRSQNYMNRVKPDRFKECSSIYKGVAWNKKGQKWIVYISFKGKQIYLGMFISEIEAAKAYDRAAIAYFDEFACLNFKREDYTINDF